MAHRKGGFTSVYCFQIELGFGVFVLYEGTCENRRTQRKPLGAKTRTLNKPQPSQESNPCHVGGRKVLSLLLRSPLYPINNLCYDNTGSKAAQLYSVLENVRYSHIMHLSPLESLNDNYGRRTEGGCLPKISCLCQ